ncbi:flagellar protein FlaG [Halomonas organivorans]|uniref:Flagellar protein FlaG n=1 Tax=Halomonas organivorans TaxID=257772 RepID=A0A7W5G4U2_9GAMM|nr:flagellar protein FlaG [Halomonas organivorans]MBB3140375.1 flagellar protein FlaG [Halomonas organivorans]
MSTSVNEIGTGQATSLSDGLSPQRRVEEMLSTWLPGSADQASRDVPPQHGELIAPVQKINEVMRPYGVQFELDEATTRMVTRLVDRQTGELIRQIPAEEVLRIAEHLEELQGRLINLEA